MQATLFGCDSVEEKPKKRRKSAAERRTEREAAFHAFVETNPHVFQMLKQMALALKRAGHNHWGMRNLYEKARYDLAIQTTETKPVLNDHYAPMFARKLMAEVPELAGMFELRERH